jgi:hypothetical protein
MSEQCSMHEIDDKFIQGFNQKVQKKENTWTTWDIINMDYIETGHNVVDSIQLQIGTVAGTLKHSRRISVNLVPLSPQKHREWGGRPRSLSNSGAHRP